MKLINVVDLIIIKNNKILLFKRLENNKLFWHIPGGKCWKNETFENTIKRELKEELNVKIKKLNYFKSYNLIFKKLDIESRAIYFYGEITGKIKLNRELLDYEWFELNDKLILKKPFFLNQKQVLKDFITFYNNKK